MNERYERIERLAERWLEARATEPRSRSCANCCGRRRSCRSRCVSCRCSSRDSGRLPGSRCPVARRRPGGHFDPMKTAPAVCRPSPVCRPNPIRPRNWTLPRSPDDRTLSSGRLSGPSSVRNRYGRRRRLFWSVAAAAVRGVGGLFLGRNCCANPTAISTANPSTTGRSPCRRPSISTPLRSLEAPDRLVDELIENN